NSVAHADGFLAFASRVVDDPEPGRELSQSAVKKMRSRHSGVSDKQGAAGRAREDLAANPGVVPADIEDADLRYRLARRHIGVPAQTRIDCEARTQAEIVLCIQ